jgi:hypothetical protein
MIKFVADLLPLNKAHKKGYVFASDCFTHLVETLKDKEILLESNIGRLYNFRIENETVKADCELFGGISVVLRPDAVVALPNGDNSVASFTLNQAKLVLMTRTSKEEKK